ncbi:MAG: N-acetylmuramoyl-L-alanine amidase [Terrimicrobiaceae bacterium]|nr:N-acetylmuramoyl-L-alanine amidase [Terrimicrobiaceae bacterium]
MISATFFRRMVAVLAWMAGASAGAWEIHQVDGRDHVSLTEVASFYAMGDESAPEPNTRKYRGDDRELVVASNSRLIILNGVAHWLAFPVRQKGDLMLVSRLDLGKTIEPAFRPQMIPGFEPVKTVVLDPGHGGQDKGARSPYEFEKNFALDVSRRVRDELKKAGLKVVMTRNSDTFVELPQRAAVANRIPNSILVSIHFNAADWNHQANGFEIFCVTPRGAPSTAYEQVTVRDMAGEAGNESDLESFALANAVYHAMHGRMEMYDRGVKRARFAVLRLAKVPAILVEGGFLTNPEDARKVASRQWRDGYARSIAQGILEYVRLASNKTPPKQVADYRGGGESGTAVAAARPTPAPASAIPLRELPSAGTN